MICPNCGADNNSVKDTMHSPDGTIYRQRKCLACGNGFKTVETPDDGSSKFKYGWYEAYKIRHPKKER